MRHHGHVRGRDDVRRLVRVQAEHGLAEQGRWAGLHHADVEVAVLHRPGEVTVLVRRPHPFVLVGRDRSPEDQRLGAAAHAGAEGADQDLPGAGLGDGDGPDLAASGAHPEGQLLHCLHPLPGSSPHAVREPGDRFGPCPSRTQHTEARCFRFRRRLTTLSARPPSSPAPGSSSPPRSGWPRSRTARAGCSASLVTVALLTDLVDGRLARATGTTSELGARLDQEADALLILVLSAIVAADLGWWVLGIGLARYVFGALFTLVGPLRSPPARPRFWCKTVAVLVGDRPRRRGRAPAARPGGDRRGRGRGGAARRVVPARGGRPLAGSGGPAGGALRHGARLPRGVAGARRPDRPRPPDRDARCCGSRSRCWWWSPCPWSRGGGCGSRSPRRPALLLGVLLLVKVLDLSFNMVFDRDFDPVGDWSYLGPGVGVLGDSIGAGWARVVAVLAGLGTLALLVGVPLAMLRLVKVAAGHRRFSLTAATALVTAWVLCFATGVQARGAPVASTSAATLTVDEVQLVRADLADPQRVLPRDRHRPLRRAGRRRPAGAALRAGRQGRAARLRRELRAGGRPGHVVLRGRHAGPRPGHPGARGGRLPLAERVPHLADVRRRQLAGALQPAVRALGRQRAPLPAAARRGPDDADQPVRAGRLADRLRRPGRHQGLARGRGVLRLRAVLRLPQRRLRGPEVRLRPDARPVHPRGLPPPRARADRPAAGDGRDRPDLQPPPVDAAAAHGPVGPGRRRLGLRRDARAGGELEGGLPGPRRGQARSTASRSSTPGRR